MECYRRILEGLFFPKTVIRLFRKFKREKQYTSEEDVPDAPDSKLTEANINTIIGQVHRITVSNETLITEKLNI